MEEPEPLFLDAYSPHGISAHRLDERLLERLAELLFVLKARTEVICFQLHGVLAAAGCLQRGLNRLLATPGITLAFAIRAFAHAHFDFPN